MMLELKKKSFLATVISIFYLVQAIAQAPTGVSRLEAEIQKLKNDSDLAHASWSVCLMSVKDGKVILEYNSAQSLVPASTLKILTTGAALSILGSDYRYKTLLEYDGELDTVNGILNGNLFITGSGDPSLGSGYFRKKNDTSSITDTWALLLRKKGIKTINGAVIADAGNFDDEPIPGTWIWNDIGNYYGAGACGLNYMDNKYTLYFNSGLTGDSVQIASIVPQLPSLHIINNVIARGSGDNAFIYGAPYTNLRYVSGTIPPAKQNYGVEGSMPDPSWYCAYALTQSLIIKGGIWVENVPATVRRLKEENKYNNAPRKTLYTHISPPLEQIVYYTNLKSNNLYAESLLKTIAVAKGRKGSSNEGINTLTNFWNSKGIDPPGLYMADGCGLSRFNAITTSQLTKALIVLARESCFKSFYASLPVAGQSGSLASLCKGTCAAGNLRAKSGYITRARGYAGYVKNKKGEELAFTILANNYDCSPSAMKRKMEKLLILIAESD